MAILAECPRCHNKQATKNKVCKCGENLDMAKKSKRVRYWIQYRLPDGKQKKEFVGKSIKEAQDADAGRRTQKVENKLEDMLDIQAEGRMTFDELSKWYLDLEKTRYEAEGLKSFRRKEDCLNNFNDVFGDTVVRNVTLEKLERYKRDRTRVVSKRQVDYEMGEAKRMVALAFDNNKVSGKTARIFRRIEKLLKVGANARKRVLELEEYVALYPHLPKHTQPLLELALFTGMRPGELMAINKSNKQETTRGLTWDRLDFKKRMIVLEEQDTKTGEARNIPITDEIDEILHRIPRDLSCNHVFTYAGEPLSSPRSGLMNACEDAGIPFGIKVRGGFVFRDLRTSTDTFMARAGVPDVYRRALMGHVQQGMDRHYVHPDFEKDLRPAMEKYTSWLREQIENVTQIVTQEAILA